MKTTKVLICAISVASAVVAAKASAQELSTTLIEITPVLTVRGTLDNGSFVQGYPSGVMHFTGFDAFCVEPTEDLSYGESLVYQVQDVSRLANFDQIAHLVGGYLHSGQTAQDAAAVHWAIWEITTETLCPPSLLDGNVRLITPDSQATADLANHYLLNINSYAPADLTYLTNAGGQDVVTWNVIPEPGSLGLVAFSTLLLLRRRR